MNKNKYLPWIVAAGFVATLAVALPVFAQTPPAGATGGMGGHFGMHGGMPPGVFGTVTGISGTTLTVTQKTRPNPSNTTVTATSTVYTVDASGAQVMKNGTSSTVSAIAQGDMVMVQGTVSGTSVTATVIRDGVMPMMGGRRGPPGAGWGGNATSTPPIQGNGEPVVGGSITAISGTTLTVTNASNITYSVDASQAKIVKNGTTTATSAIATGDNVVIQGTVNGTSVVASSVIDQGSGTQGGSTAKSSGGFSFGFFGAIGNFFKHLFGF